MHQQPHAYLVAIGTRFLCHIHARPGRTRRAGAGAGPVSVTQGPFHILIIIALRVKLLNIRRIGLHSHWLAVLRGVQIFLPLCARVALAAAKAFTCTAAKQQNAAKQLIGKAPRKP
jgi:hypothetical protein